MIDRYLALNSWFSLYELDTNSVADRLLQRMYETEPEHALETLRKLLLCGQPEMDCRVLPASVVAARASRQPRAGRAGAVAAA